MIRSACLFASAAVAALVPQLALAQSISSIEADALAFGVREGVADMDLSPDGNRAVFVGPGPGRTTIVYIADIVAGTTTPILSSKSDPETLRSCAFVSNDRLACRFTAIIKAGDGLIPASRMIALDTTGKNIKELGQKASQYDWGYRQHDGSIIDWLPGDNNAVLMTRTYLAEAGHSGNSNISRTKEGVGVVKIDVATLKTTNVEPPRNSVATYMSDGRGQVRLIGIAELSSETLLTGRVKYDYRQLGSRGWKDLVGYQDGGFSPLAIDATINSLYALRKRDGRFALTKILLDGSMTETLVASNPRVDIDDVVRIGNGQKVIGYAFVDDRRRVVYFDPEYKALSASLRKALPNLPLVRFVNASQDGNKVLLVANSDNDAGRFYLFDKSKKSLGELMPVRPGLTGRTLASVKSVTYKAADGTLVPAYLTLPVGKAAKGLPAVVMPHGGPSSRDEWGFDWLAQFLAARGYAVIQPNYRGSSGFGDMWAAENGFKGWRTAIGDVSAAARYLASEGIADPKRMAILGWSYGGYAALQSAVIDPSLYKAVVAIAPVTDFAMFKADSADFTNARVMEEFVGSGAHISEGSPLRHASAISAPVLLVHGDLDVNVGVAQSQKMDAALRSAGKSSELLLFKGLDHQLEDSEARALVLAKVGALLERTIGH
ncbi:MAG TPA: S9 family peptidase [Sphingomicrobium sp.]|nr:S9 family peptidase [Sphingomicrobium sp.]